MKREMEGIFDGNFTAWVIIPLLIVAARVLDVSFGTIRIILIGKGYKKIAPALGFIESLVWLLAASKVLQNLDNTLYFIAYALGYATGTYVGMALENILSLGQVIIRVITKYDADELASSLIKENYNLTTVEAVGKYGKVKIIFMIMNRNQVKEAIKTIEEYNPQAFYSIEDIRYVRQQYLPGDPNPMANKIRFMFKATSIRK